MTAIINTKKIKKQSNTITKNKEKSNKEKLRKELQESLESGRSNLII